ncbi:glutathione S-transferase family protein [Pelagovum pacificum]|uniref:Glutathione S-transferase family protein n=1 Tax=Pelagovum pacificum TaxID=2588711 RepID=A0A5C5GFI6_9RHOB|nr:glutathione S-transferase family protein [Pelagovum pacificum]QQA43331.1 glutathione S-transferase family protein [Pelagovum pacificum]TNY33532.1 glutathione S-transferase family protein [Pelagovum pacificum]
MKLYCFGESGNAYKVALALELLNESWEPVHVDFFNGETRSPEFRKINVMGEVPVLVDGDVTVSQSGNILDYISTITGELGGTFAADRREVSRWILFDTQKLSGQAGPLRFMMNFLPEDKRDQAVIDWMTGRFRAALQILEAHLAGNDWIASGKVTIADCACAGYLFYEEPFAFDRGEWPNIDAWLDRLSALPGWKPPYDLMQRAFPPAS